MANKKVLIAIQQIVMRMIPVRGAQLIIRIAKQNTKYFEKTFSLRYFVKNPEANKYNKAVSITPLRASINKVIYMTIPFRYAARHQKEMKHRCL